MVRATEREEKERDRDYDPRSILGESWANQETGVRPVKKRTEKKNEQRGTTEENRGEREAGSVRARCSGSVARTA
jgi:hypothetical protein